MNRNAGGGDNSNVPKCLWISWEKEASIRSRVLAKEMKCDYCAIAIFDGKKFLSPFRYLISTILTFMAIWKKKPDVLIVQNPSVVLSYVSSLIKNLFAYYLVIDMHTQYIHPVGIKKILLDYLNKHALNNCNLIIVTNESYKKKIENVTGEDIYVLPDKIPDMDFTFKKLLLKGRQNVLYICSFSEDEPWGEVIHAAYQLNQDCYIYITGRNKSKLQVPDNVVLTGYIPNEEYQNLLRSADTIMVLTNEEDCMVCGAYEAVAAGKPLILSDKKVLQEYFDKGTVFTSNDKNGISQSIKKALLGKKELEDDIMELKRIREVEWENKWDGLMQYIYNGANIKKKKIPDGKSSH